MRATFFDDFIEPVKKKMRPSYQKNTHDVDCTLLTEEDYNREVQKLIYSRVDNKNIFGYKTDKGQYKKFNKDLELLVIYDDKNNKIKSYHTSYREYNGNKWDDYQDEI